jgi:hypothetical protein
VKNFQKAKENKKGTQRRIKNNRAILEEKQKEYDETNHKYLILYLSSREVN